MRVGALNAAHDVTIAEKEQNFKKNNIAFEEYFPIVENPYFIMFDPDNMTPAVLAKYMRAEGLITERQYHIALSYNGANTTLYNSRSAVYLINRLRKKNFDCIAFMNERFDPGSIGLIVFDKSQLIPVAIDGLPVENSDRTLADSDNEPAFFVPENENENFVEKDNENIFDIDNYSGYNETNLVGLSYNEKIEIKQKTGWSDEIIDYIHSIKEAQIYIDADLKETEINGRKCLIRADIDMEQIDKNGVTNRELIMFGKSPINIYGERVELHHIGQKQDSPFAELTEREHRSKGNHRILHTVKKPTEIVRNIFNLERKEYWQIRAEIKGGNYE